MNSNILDNGKLISKKLKDILSCFFAEKGIKPGKGEFDALVDDIQVYIENSLEEFIRFYNGNRET